MTQAIEDALNLIERRLSTNARTNEDNLGEVENAVKGSGALLAKIIDALFGAEKVQLQLLRVGIASEKIASTAADENGKLLGGLRTVQNKVLELAEGGSRQVNKDAIRMIGYLELQGRSSEHIVDYMNDLVAMGATAEDQKQMAKHLLNIENTSNLTSEAALAALDPLEKFRIQMEALGQGTFKDLSKILTNIGTKFEFGPKGMRMLGDVVAAMYDGNNLQQTAFLQLNDNTAKMYDQNATLEERQEAIVNALTEGGALQKELLGIGKGTAVAHVHQAHLVRMFGEFGTKLATMADMIENAQKTSEAWKADDETLGKRIAHSQDSASQSLKDMEDVFVKFADWAIKQGGFQTLVGGISDFVVGVADFVAAVKRLTPEAALDEAGEGAMKVVNWSLDQIDTFFSWINDQVKISELQLKTQQEIRDATLNSGSEVKLT